MTIEIDDSGTGDLIGPAFILFWRRETNTLIKKEVPLELYQREDFNKLTKEYIRDLFENVFAEMKIPSTEDIWLCTGPCFDEARKWLKEKNFNFHDAKIEGYLQTQVETTYLDYIINNYNFPQDKASIESGKKRFYAIFDWVAQDFPRRSKFVKSGFEKWQAKLKREAEELWMKKMVSVNSIRKNGNDRVQMGKKEQKKTKKKSNAPKRKAIKKSSSRSKKFPVSKRPKKRSRNIQKNRDKNREKNPKTKSDPMQRFY